MERTSVSIDDPWSEEPETSDSQSDSPLLGGMDDEAG
jgi:hypothetical protein